MNKYIKINRSYYWFELSADKPTAVFGACGDILASAIHRMNKSRYKVYIIWTGGVMDMVFDGIGAAIDSLQDFYDNAV